jgi:hypothetical protein
MAGYSSITFFFNGILTNHCAAVVPSVKNTCLILYIRPVEAQLRKDRPRSDPIKGIGRIKRHICQILFSIFILKKKEKYFWRKVSGSSRTILPNHLTRT